MFNCELNFVEAISKEIEQKKRVQADQFKCEIFYYLFINSSDLAWNRFMSFDWWLAATNKAHFIIIQQHIWKPLEREVFLTCCKKKNLNENDNHVNYSNNEVNVTDRLI